MGVASTVAMGSLVDGFIFNFACNISNYLYTNFGAFDFQMLASKLMFF